MMLRATKMLLVCGLLACMPSHAQDGGNANQRLAAAINKEDGDTIQIAPMTKPGEDRPGTWTNIDGGILDAIFHRVGIVPGKTNPKDLEAKKGEGFLEYIDDSYVVNAGGSRATIGYFIKKTHPEKYFNGQLQEPGFERTYFVLFSYDMVRVRGIPLHSANKTLVATELFLFAGSSLVEGLAVGADGKLLDEVPPQLAKVSNFKGAKGHEGETVKPGVSERGKGCLACHSNETGMPQNTGPFPWSSLSTYADYPWVPAKKPPETPSAVTTPSTPEPATAATTPDTPEPAKAVTAPDTPQPAQGAPAETGPRKAGSTPAGAKTKQGSAGQRQKGRRATSSTAASSKSKGTSTEDASALIESGISIGVGIARAHGRREGEHRERERAGSRQDMGRQDMGRQDMGRGGGMMIVPMFGGR